MSGAAATAEPARGAHRKRSARRGGPAALFAGPGLIWIALLIVVPYAGILVFSFFSTDQVNLIPDFNLDNFSRVFTDDVVRTVFLRTLWIALAVTALTLLIALPLAYYAAFHVKHKQVFVFLLLVPMWVSYIVRLYAWRTLLGEDGVVNKALEGIGLIDEPLTFILYSPTAVVLTLTYVYLPFMFIALFGAMQGIDRTTLHAAADLYASPIRRFFKVTLPLCKPGMAAGVMLVFPLAFGDYIAPALVGGTDGQMFANLIQQQFGTTFDYPFGAALAVALLVVVLGMVTLLERWRKDIDVPLY